MRARTRTGQSSKEANSIPLFFDEDMVSIPRKELWTNFGDCHASCHYVIENEESGERIFINTRDERKN
jgi:hypothetical protein